MIGNLGPILSGITMSAVSKYVAARISNDEAAFEVSLKVLTGAMMAAGGIVGCLHWLTYVLNEREVSAAAASSVKSSESGSKAKSAEVAAVAAAVAKEDGKAVKRKKMSFLESIQVLAADPYLSQVAVMVLSYGLTMEFTEIIWKASVKKAFPIKTDYLGNANQLCSTCSTVLVDAWLLLHHSYIHSFIRRIVCTQHSWVDTAHWWGQLPSS